MSTLIAQTGWSTYDSARGRCSLYWDETTNQSTNVSVLNYSLIMDTEPTGYYRTLISGTLTIDGNTITLPSNKRFYNGNTITSGSLTIQHESNGEKTISVNIYVNIGGDIRTADATVTLTKINRGNEFTVNPSYTIGANISIGVTKYISTYRSEIRYVLNDVNYILVAKESDSSLDTSFTLLYSDIASHMSEYTSATLTLLCYTYNDDLTELINTKTFYITVSTGTIPISMYDDRAGNVGVTIGEQATGPGFKVMMDSVYFKDTSWIPTSKLNWTQAWSGKCVGTSASITATVPTTAIAVVLRWYIGSYYSTLYLPKIMLNTTATKYIVSDDEYYAGGTVKISGTTLTYVHTGQYNNNCYLDKVYYLS